MNSNQTHVMTAFSCGSTPLKEQSISPKVNYFDIQRILPVAIEKCAQDVRWAYKQSVELQLMYQDVQKKEYFSLKKENKALANEQLSLAASYRTAYKIRKLIEKKSITDIDNIDELRIVEQLNIAKHRPNRKKPKWEWLLNHQSEIQAMVTDRYSTRAMSSYFLSIHRFSVSHAFIANFIKSKKEI